MDDDGNQDQKPSKRPVINLPPRPFTDALFNGGSSFRGFSPGPMTLVSNYFSSTEDFKSFSQLLADAMASPAAARAKRPDFPIPTTTEQQGDVNRAEGLAESGLRFKQNKPAGLVISQPQPFFAVPQGFNSPASLLESPGFSVFSSGAQGPFVMTHQQALAQVTAQASQAHSLVQIHAESSSTPPSSLPQVSSFAANMDSCVTMKQLPDVSQSDQRSQPASFIVDKPGGDGYNWRKYGQKKVKGCEFPRSYYKCTHPACPVKKKVERSLDGQVSEIIYKGQHNHQPPRSNKPAKGSGSLSGNSNNQGNSESTSQLQSGNLSMTGYSLSKKEPESSLTIVERISGTSDSDEARNNETDADEKDEDEPGSKRQYAKISSHRTVTEPRVIVQTRSEVDLLSDGYRWRKYGQKVVKGNPYPRSYYKCTTPGCNVRKHVERASKDPKSVITTYEGKHNHDVPAAKTGSHSMANTTDVSQERTQNIETDNHGVNISADSTSNRQQPVAHLISLNCS